ncbi:MAG TPA: TIGR03617 family F420-dependent LLM class oxidoreductase [Anaerolineales bacterium]|nr:TIGR03617 family F420-dependent LLM class oxidoreductase [Anaerolineales bacterium]
MSTTSLLFDATLPLVPLTMVPGIAQGAEKMGFNTLWTTETMHDPFLPGPLIAEHTRTLRFGTAVAIAFARSPASLAYTAWDLAEASQGRFILGLGTQVKAHIERRYGMPWPESVVGKLREQITAIRAFWNTWQNNAPLNHRGEHYKLTLMSPFFNPGPIHYPDIPIYIAGVNTGLARLAGEVAQGFHAHPFHTARYLGEVILPAIIQGVSKAGRSRTDVKVSTSAFIVTSPEEEFFVRSQIAFYASTPSYRPVMVLHGWEETAHQLSALAARAAWTEMSALITDDMLAEFAIIASPAQIPAALHARYQDLVDRIGLYSPFRPGERDDFWMTLLRGV